MSKKLLLLALFFLWAVLVSEMLNQASGIDRSAPGGEAFAQSVDTAWVRRYNGPGNSRDAANALAVDDSGNVYVTGEGEGSGTDFDYATIKYLPNGDTAWVRGYNGPGNSMDEANALAVDGSGNVYVTGESYGSGTSSWDYATLKYVKYICGDANGDEKVTLADIVFLVSYLFKFGPAPSPLARGDANGDGKVTIADIVYLVSFLFKFGPSPRC